MKIAILGAMREEITPILEHYKQYEEITFGGNTFYKIIDNPLEIIVAYSRIGKVHAAISACSMILHFGCKKLIFSGVAGAINPKLRIGDLLLGLELCQHDVDITAFGHPFGFIPESELFVSSDSTLNEIAHKVAMQKGIILHEGIIATGDQFIANSTKKEWIGNEFKADALEMEGASVAVVCKNLNVPFCILRAISDAADMEADFKFDQFLEQSAKNSADFVIRMLELLKK